MNLEVGLEVADLTVARGGVAVLEGVSFVLAPGEALILRGPNGAGKTTLLRTLAGLQRAVRGTVSMPPDAVAYAAHADGLKAQLSVTENLDFWARVHGHTEIGDALEGFNLIELAQRRAGELSAGQRRRLALARLVVARRPVWLLDEPTVSLDEASVALFAAAVRRHLDGGGMAVIATHIGLGLSEPRVLDVAGYKARPGALEDDFDEAFL